MKRFNNFALLFALILLGCNRHQVLVTPPELLSFISHDNDNIQYGGRVGLSEDSTATEIYWSGSSVQIDFDGTGIKVVLKDEKYQNYFNVILDGNLIEVIRPDTLKTTYSLAENLSNGNHSIILFKRTEWTKGKTSIYGFYPEIDTKIIPPANTNNRMIEFYGNSITCGYAVEDDSGKDSPDSIFTNNYLAYGAITARHFKADYTCIARSGIGLTISWFDQIMQELYYRQNPADPESNWDFSLKTPDIVVINLFQNDSWLTNRPEFVEFKRRFGDTKPSPEFIIATYADFITKLRGHYPHASIICMLGSMDATQTGSVWPEYIETAVKRIQDEKIYPFFVAYKDTGGHPSVKEQQEIADKLIGFIETKIGW